jgi:hypothetical protein
MTLYSFISDIFFLLFLSFSLFYIIFTCGNAGPSDIMLRQTSSICFIVIKLFFALFNKAECKSGGGHYSSQRLGSGSSSGHGLTGGSQLPNPMQWGNPWMPSDMHPWYDYGT